jgi:hypothetical protein
MPPLDSGNPQSSARSHHGDGGACARFELTDLLRCLDERADLRRRIVRSYVLCFVTEKKLAILEADAGNPQPMTICVLPMSLPVSVKVVVARFKLPPDYLPEAD